MPLFFFLSPLNSWFLIGRCCPGSRPQPQSPGPVSGRVEARSAAQHPRSAAHPAPGDEERAFCPRKAAPLSRYQERCPQRSLATDLAGEMGSGFGIRIQHLGTEEGWRCPERPGDSGQRGQGREARRRGKAGCGAGPLLCVPCPYLSRDGGKARGGTNMTDPPKERYLPGLLSESLQRPKARGVCLFSRPLSGIEAVGKGDWEIFGFRCPINLFPFLRG